MRMGAYKGGPELWTSIIWNEDTVKSYETIAKRLLWKSFILINHNSWGLSLRKDTDAMCLHLFNCNWVWV